MLDHIKKTVYRKIRYHWMTERIQYELRRDSTLKLSENRGIAQNLEFKVTPGDIIIDCGANIGDVTSLFARSGATVYAFEPNPLCFDILSKRFSAMPMVYCLNQGVTDHDCKMTLSTPGPHAHFDMLDTTITSSFISGAMHADQYAVQEAEIECIDLDSFIHKLRRRVRFLKLDIEGSEVAVINRLIDTGSIDLIDSVAAETHEDVIPELKEATDALRQRIQNTGLGMKIRLDWN